MKKNILGATLAVLFGVTLSAAPLPQAAQKSAPTVKVGAAVASKAAAPAPSATATNQAKKTAIGKGHVAVKASGPSSFWTETIDLEDDGTVEATDFLYDASRGVVYAYREDDFTCPNGAAGRGKVMEAIYAQGNKAGKPAGSGWYAVELNEGKCGVKKAGAYGCTFDAAGNATACGAATVNTATGEVDVVEVQ